VPSRHHLISWRLQKATPRGSPKGDAWDRQGDAWGIAKRRRLGSSGLFQQGIAQMTTELKTSRQIYDESVKVRRQVDDGQPRQSEDDIQREQLGPRGVPGKPDPAKMVPQRKKKTPSDFDPGHTA
jgi:hypothetical protein